MKAVSNLVLTVGDEHRAKSIALMFDGARQISLPADGILPILSNNSHSVGIKGVYGYRSSRGFLTYTGRYKGFPVSVVSIGMGYPNMDFFVREVREIVNGPLVIIRVGSCGTIADGHIGMLAIPDEGAFMVQRNYDYPFSLPSKDLETLKDLANISDGLEQPYRISRLHHPHKKLSEALVREACIQVGRDNILCGINASSDSFYSSQGRPNDSFLDKNDDLISNLLGRGVKTFEMETGQLFHLASCVKNQERAIYAAAIHIILADRRRNEFLSDLEQRTRLDRMAACVALEALISIELDTEHLNSVTVV